MKNMKNQKVLKTIAIICAIAIANFFIGGIAEGAGTPSLSLQGGTAARGGSIGLNLSIDTASASIAGVQWDFLFNPADIASVSVSAGPAAAAAGKSVACNTISGGDFRCLVFGYNANAIGSGILSVATFTLTGTTVASSIPISFSGVLASDPNANYVSIVGAGSSIAVTGSPPSPTFDATPPAVSLTAPIVGLPVSGTAVAVSATASDNVGIAGVQFKLNGTNLGAEDTIAPYSVFWNTTTAANVSHTLTALARDAAGNTAVSAAVSVVVNNSASTPTPSPLPPTGTDTTAPAAISDLAASQVTPTSFTLTWTAPGDDNTTGQALSYELRYYINPITDANFALNSKALGVPTPAVAGSKQTYTFADLKTDLIYYAAIKTTDDTGNVSGLSNVVSFLTAQSSATPSSPPAPTVTLVTPAVRQNNILVKYTSSATVYLLENNLKRGIPSYDIYLNRFRLHPIAAIPETEIYQDGPLLVFPPGTLLKTPGNPTVYLTLDNGKRYGFRSADEFQRFGFRFDLIKTIFDNELNYYPLSDIASLSFHATGNLVKYANNPTVYRIENNTKRGISSPEIFLHYGAFSDVLIIAPSFQYLDGPILNYPDGALVKGTAPTVYLIAGGKKHPFTSAAQFFSEGYNFSMIRAARDEDLLRME